VTSNDSGDERQVTKPPVAPRTRPGRPASSARRPTNDNGDSPTGPTPRKRAPTRASATTTVDDAAFDDTAETDKPGVIPPDPLLRAKVTENNGNGNGSSNGSNGRRSSDGPKSNGAPRNGSAVRAKAGNGTIDGRPRPGSAPIEAAAVETAAVDAETVDTPTVQPTTAEKAAAPEVGETASTDPVADEVPAATVGAAPHVAADTPTVVTPAPLAPPLAPPVVESEPASPDAVVADPQPIPDVAGGEADADPSSAPTRAPSRWSLRNLLSKLPTTGPVQVTDLAPPSPPDITTVPVSELEPTARSSSSPITSPIPVQPPPTSGEALTSVNPEPVPARSFVRPLGLMPDQPPYIRPTPTFDPGMFRSGPVELDPALDPDLPQRPPRLKPVHVAAVRRRGRPRMRRVTRVVRHVDPWSVFKVALCFSLVLYGVCLTAGVLLWNVAYTTGTIDNVQRFFESFGWDTFRFNGGELYHNAWIAGLFCAIGLTGLIVLAATLFNLITDLVGGIRVTVLEEEVIERDPAERRTLLRRRSQHSTSTVPAHGHRDDEESIELYEHLG